ncbi:GNAT family N-acetyltransferase [Nocardia goodfellowii]|uniref:RimJ/RimL family protein N-acetyltransferase n=1 Tax=Nocardia goodfellowii TaxID=882446 RepID=A0ABS4QEY1_9NOCA|nr:GNAT family N-acetyltransferase [Nocardia goodfellowii]MBP2190264.1 RimJ/RimL family protein N-acetyltransferase [Nocardia goodfellowii]
MLTEMRTERLVLRKPRESDRETVVALQTDPEAERLNPKPHTADGARALFDMWLQQWTEHGFGYLIVSERDHPDDILGFGGVRYLEWHGEQVLNLAYRFWPRAWGKGYATEMAAAVVDWAQRQLPGVPIAADITVSNEPSLRVAERLGFEVHTAEEFGGERSLHMRR